VAKKLCPEKPVFSHPAFDHETRIVEVAVGGLDIASIYVPNGGKDYPAKVAFVQAMAEYVRAKHAAGRELVLCGDMNVAFEERDVHPKERKPGIIGQRPEERELFQAVLGAGLTDVGRAQAPDDDGLFSWWPYWRNMRQRNIGWRLDYVLASAPVARRVTACKILTEIGTSDHAPVMVTLS
jgi:exodeoxyribonuclease-3